MKKTSPLPSSLALLAALWPCAFYLLCSLTMNLLTKTLVTTFQWRSVYTLGAIQSLFTLTSLTLLSTVQRVFAFVVGAKQQPSVQHEDPVKIMYRGIAYVLRVLLPLVALHVSNMLLSFTSLRVVNLPMCVSSSFISTLVLCVLVWD